MTDDEAKEVEAGVNQVTSANLDVTEGIVSLEEAARNFNLNTAWWPDGTLLIGLVFFAVIPFLYLLVQSYNSLLIVRFLHGFATAIYGPVIMAVVVDMAGKKRGEMLSLFSSVTIIGNLVGAPLGGFLLGRLAGGGEQQLVHFHIIYGVVAALGMIALLIGVWASSSLTASSTNGTGKSTVSAVISHFWNSLKNILIDRRIVVTSNMEGVQNLSVGALEAFMPIYIVMILGYSVFQAGLIIAGRYS